MTPRLTIVLPTKDRYLFTLRFLWHANRARMPYRFLIADGHVHATLAEMLANSAEHFPNLDIQYIRYPDDRNFSRYFAKMADALSRVMTPYAMLVDNDDLLAPAAIERALDFLESHADYVCCGGRMTGFSVYSGLNNPSRGLRGKLHRLFTYPLPQSVSSPLVAERLHQGSLDLWIYYSVHRAEALAAIWREIAELDFSDLLVYEVFSVMRSLTFGKAQAYPDTTTYICQIGTSMNYSFKKDWMHHLLRSRFTTDIHAVVERISGLAAVADGIDPAVAAEGVREVLDRKFQQFVWASYGSLRGLKQIVRERAPFVVTWWQNWPNYFVGRHRSALFRSHAKSGTSKEYLAQFRCEIAAVENLVSGDDFATFIRPYQKVFDPTEERKTEPGAIAGLPRRGSSSIFAE